MRKKHYKKTAERMQAAFATNAMTSAHRVKQKQHTYFKR